MQRDGPSRTLHDESHDPNPPDPVIRSKQSYDLDMEIERDDYRSFRYKII